MEKIDQPIPDLDAQLLIDNPADNIDAMCMYEKTLQEHLAVMQSHRPEHARNRFVRHMRKPILSALTAHFYVDLMKNNLPKLQEDDLEIFEIEKVQNGSREYHGSAARFVHTLTTHFQSNFAGLRERIEDPNDEYHNLWLCHDAGVDLVKSAHFPISRWPKERHLSMESIFEDNADVALDIILQQCRRTMSLHSSVSPNMSELTSTVVRNSRLAIALATTNKNLMRKLVHGEPVGPHFEKYEHSILQDELDFLAECPELIADGLNMTFHHPSLQLGGWPSEGFCPAPSTLRPRDLIDCQVVENFFRFFEDRYNCKITRGHKTSPEHIGAFDRVSVLMLLATYIAEKTIFPAWPRFLGGNSRNTFAFLM